MADMTREPKHAQLDAEQAVPLTRNESEWLVKMASGFQGKLSLLVDKPPRRTMNSLVKKGLARDIMGTFWEVTPLGRERCKTIY